MVEYGHCPKCAQYQPLLGEPIHVSDGDYLEIIGVGRCWLCSSLFEWLIVRFEWY